MATTTDNDNALLRSMPLIKEANGKGNDDDAPTTLLLARFIENFCLWIGGPVVILAIVVVQRGGDMNQHVPQGVPMVMEKSWRGSGIVIGKTKIGKSESSNNWQ
jgi:hypothetical protein